MTYALVDEDSDGTADYIEITGCDEDVTEVVIPSEIDGVAVTSIGDYAFYSCNSITTIELPDSLTNIGGGAFLGCINIESIIIPESVKSIGGTAFCTCTKLASVEIPDNITSIGGEAFENTPWLEEKRAENPLVIINSILIDGKTCEGDVVIPDNVVSIGGSAFRYCENLKSITIPNSVTKIEGWAFGECTNLMNVIIPNSVTEISGLAFDNCANLASITIENPECEIADLPTTISNGTDFDAVGGENSIFYFNGTIYGYTNSTAQAYAEKYERNFISLGDYEVPTTEPTTEPIVTTAPVTTTEAETTTVPVTTTTPITTTESTENETIVGDITGDSAINLYDVIEIAKYMVGMITLDDEQLSIGDMNSDGIVNLYDAIAIAQIIMSK